MKFQRKPDNGLLRLEIDLGTGSKALAFYNQLLDMMQDIKHALDRYQLPYLAYVLYKWELSSRFRIVEAPHWVLELDAIEWQALSRGLRLLDTKGVSLYQRLLRNKAGEHYDIHRS